MNSKNFVNEQPRPLKEKKNFIDTFNDCFTNAKSSKSDYLIYLSDKIIVFEPDLFIELLKKFVISGKIGIVKDNHTGLRLKGLFRVPNLLTDMIFLDLKKVKSSYKIEEPRHFYNSEQSACDEKIHRRKNFLSRDIFT